MSDIALVMIVKDEARRIERCLASVRPYVTRMVITDTGSTDQTVEICKRLGAEIHHFDWCGDFSAARNFSLDVANADWHLVLDADEWLVQPPVGGLAALAQASIGLVKRIDFYESQGQTQSAVTWIPRLLPRQVRFEGTVHEQPISDLPRQKTPLLLHHDGYLPNQHAAKKGRNKALLLEMLKATPHDPYVLYQLGVDDEVYGDFSSAARYYEQAHHWLDRAFAYHLVMVVRWLHCLTQSRQARQAVQLVHALEPTCAHSPDFFFAAGNVYLEMASQDPSQALRQWLPMAIACWERCLLIGEKPDMEGAVAGRGSYLAAQNLHAIYSVLGDTQPAEAYARLAQNRPAQAL